MGEQGRALWKTRSRICVVVLCICILLAFLRTHNDQNCSIILEVVGAVIASIVGFISWDISSLNPSDNYSLKVTWQHYKFIRSALLFGKLYVRKFLKGTANVMFQQQILLQSIIDDNKDTVYGTKFKFEDIKNVNTFLQKVPLTTYDNYKSYAEQLCEGKNNILTKETCYGFARSSGTTGNPKLIPWNNIYRKNMLKIVFVPSYAVTLKGRRLNLNKVLLLVFKQTIKKFESGLEAGSMIYMLYKSKKLAQPMQFFVCSPSIMARYIDNEQTAFYLHALFALQEWDLGGMEIWRISQAHAFWQYVQKHIDEICKDIETGIINVKLDLSEEVRSKFEKNLFPDAQRSFEVKKQFQLGSVGLAKRLWPSITYLRTISTKTTIAHETYLKETIYKDVLIQTVYYGATEGTFGLDLCPVELDNKFLLAYPLGFYEFIPEEDCDEEQPKTLLAHQLEVGKSYELVVTNELGLYRYRMGDVIEVSSYEGQCPVMNVMYRRGKLLDVSCEKTPESVFSEAVFKACQKLDVKLQEYTATESNNAYGDEGSAKQYTLFIETQTKVDKQKLSVFDESLCEIFERYKELRYSGNIECMNVVQMAEGTFLKLKEIMVVDRQSAQVKMPRALRDKKYLQYLLDNQI